MTRGLKCQITACDAAVMFCSRVYACMPSCAFVAVQQVGCDALDVCLLVLWQV